MGSRATVVPIDASGATVPPLLYGTAWKEAETEELVVAALEAGFRGFDTANQRRHYLEEGVGRALARVRIPRAELFVQTKFTFLDGQDHRLPYDARAPVAEQVRQSFASSLSHLGLMRLDSLLLHGPSRREGLGPADREAWRAMEALADSGQVRLLGISNVTVSQLEELAGLARVAPAFVQNRCYASLGWDREVRAACRDLGIAYQAFSLLTANRRALASPALRAIAARHRRTEAQVVFRFAQQLGMVPLTGTRSAAHMQEDLAATAFTLEDGELRVLESVDL